MTGKVGSRAQVMHGTAHHTVGGLQKKDLKYVDGHIKSKRASAASKKSSKSSSFKKFINYVSKSKKFRLAPKKGTVAYKKLMYFSKSK